MQLYPTLGITKVPGAFREHENAAFSVDDMDNTMEGNEPTDATHSEPNLNVVFWSHIVQKGFQVYGVIPSRIVLLRRAAPAPLMRLVPTWGGADSLGTGCFQAGSVIGLVVVVPAVLYRNMHAGMRFGAQQAKVLSALAKSAAIGTVATGVTPMPCIVMPKPCQGPSVACIEILAI